MIYTFYSYKGGVGRSTALANVAEIFYRAGLRVLVVDWDLESPQLESFFPIRQDEALSQRGIIDMLLGYMDQMTKEWPNSLDAGKILPLENLDQFLIDVYEDETRPGRLWLLPAGRRSNDYFNIYSYAVSNFDWHSFYHNWEGELYFEWLRQQFEQIADVILIDSRTGVTEMGGVCSYQLADVLVTFCTTNEQMIEGTYQIVKNFTRQEVQEVRGRPLQALVIPARVERLAETQLLNEFRQRFANLFGEFMPSALSNDPYIFIELELPEIPAIRYWGLSAREQEEWKKSIEWDQAIHNLVKAMSLLAPTDSRISSAVSKIV